MGDLFELLSSNVVDAGEPAARLAPPDRLQFELAIDRWIRAFGMENTAVGLIDINGFSELLARNGQQYANALLCGVAARISEVFRDDRIVGRIGMDTFGVVGHLEEVTHRRLKDVKRNPFLIAGQKNMISVSIGIAQGKECDGTGHALLLAATLAMKSAKVKGYGGHAYYSHEMGLAARRRSELMGLLHAAVQGRDMYLAFQPQLALPPVGLAAIPVGVEALLRWRLSTGEMVPPDVFLPLAEQSGLATSLGYQVISMALETEQRLRAQGFAGLRMAVNVSVPQFRDSAFADTVRQAMTDSGCSPDALELEITESVAGLGEEHLIDVLKELQALGVSIAIDDFGTGYSSLAYINRLPADRLKIDKSFVNSLGVAGPEACIAKTIIGMGHALGLTVLAEGVETEAQLLALQGIGCDEVQGFYFAKPMVEQDLVAWLREQLRTG
ncbi:MAG: hypothetical protein BGO63_03610 [Candidatus Accumulibacter sp. 66-26]|nr:MAG: hypothetical protein BGO63_03610 [Candidatus Accumulibacter sp. 66-26]